MSLIKCPECNNDVSEYADKCPNCGCPIDVIKNEINNKLKELKENLPEICPICGEPSANIKDDMTCPICGFVYDKTKDELEQYKKECRLNQQSSSAPTTQPQNVPKCPTCGSTNISKIGTGERVMSVLGLGLLSKKINKTWKCNNCGHTW